MKPSHTYDPGRMPPTSAAAVASTAFQKECKPSFSRTDSSGLTCVMTSASCEEDDLSTVEDWRDASDIGQMARQVTSIDIHSLIGSNCVYIPSTSLGMICHCRKKALDASVSIRSEEQRLGFTDHVSFVDVILQGLDLIPHRE